MSDSLPPDEGPDPYEGQDLEGLLSGTDDSFPAGLRQVAVTLDALRAPPMRGELGGEAAARADFRRLMLGTGSGAWSPDDSGDARTLILPVEAASVGQRPLQGRHRRRRPARRMNWQAKALAGAAAAAVVVVGVGVAALAGTFSGSSSPSVQAGSSFSASTTTSPSKTSGSKGVEGSGNATHEPTHSSSPTASKQSGDDADTKARELCSEYWSPEYPLSQRDSYALFLQLSHLADGAGNVRPYCKQVLQHSDAGSTNQGNQGSHGIDGHAGHNGNGPGRSDRGSGGQNQQNQQ
jgi:hypothetical protein